MLVAGCGGAGVASDVTRIADTWPEVDATIVEATPFAPDRACSGRFVPLDLDHVTAGAGTTASTFDGTGSGLAAGDLDGDGDDDLVVANLSGATSLFENITDPGTVPRFRRSDLIDGRFRQVAIVDVDGDRHRDIVLTTGVGPPTVFWNAGVDTGLSPERFERDQLPGVRAATYSLAWGDLGGDGDLDLVTGSYNAELTQLRNSPVLGSDTGVLVHERTDPERTADYEATRIASESQALAIRLVDLDGDRSTDIWVGNDLATPDGVWTDNDGGWLPRPDLLGASSFSTMSVDAGDIDNDGRFELFASDMMPMTDDPENLARYAEVTEDMAAMPMPDDVQHPANVLLDRAGDDEGQPFTDLAGDTPIQATGWSWSGVFGDLDSDGSLDLYVVNGMRSESLFGFLPNATLIEPNQAFRNRDGVLEPAPEWGLVDDEGGRGLVLVDIDGDGDLDAIVNNLAAPTRLFENQLCGSDGIAGADLIVSLDWPASQNPDAIGAVIELALADGTILTRTVDATRGYLSGGPLTAHFGVGAVTDEAASGEADLTVLWPDGHRSVVTGVPLDHSLTIERQS